MSKNSVNNREFKENINNKTPEILAPCGKFETLESAIIAGGDAVYLAGKAYGARAFAGNFDDQEMIQAIKLCHLYNVKVYVTVNTVIFENEIDECIKYIDFLYLNDVDAIIIQDLGLSTIIRSRYPDLEMHASTQINAQTVDDVKMLKNLGFSRVVLGREVSIETIKKIKQEVDIEIEVFIHGALCISYSGNCFYSLLEGGRSGNRGRCAQPCRLKHSFRGKDKFYISPKDLCTIDYIREIGKYADSLKIEGRMKSKEYVYHVIKAYKYALNSNYKDANQELYKSKIAFNREYTKGFINNANNVDITNVNSSNHLGVLIGEITKKNTIGNNFYEIGLNSELSINDSIRIVGKGQSGIIEDAVIVNEIYQVSKGKKILIKNAKTNDVINIRLHKRMNIGDKVYLTKRQEDIKLIEYVNSDGSNNIKTIRYLDKYNIEINAKCYLDEYNDFTLEITDGINIVSGICEYEKSEKDLSERIKEQINKTGGTPFIFTNIDVNLPYIYVKVKDINNLRRDLFEDLIRLRENKYSRNIKNIKKDTCILNTNNVKNKLDIKEQFEEHFSVCLTNINQVNKLDDVIEGFINTQKIDLYLRQNYNILNYKHYYGNIYRYLPRVCDLFDNDGVNAVVSNIGSLIEAKKRKTNIVTSVYMNVTNSFTVRLLESLGANRIGLSIELSKEQIRDLIKGYKERYKTIPNIEVMIYGYYQMMYMKHCFINKELGYNKLHCNACHKDRLHLDDYPLLGDEKCHLSILYKDPINLCSYIDELKSIGIKNFIIDYTIENEDEMKNILELKKSLQPYTGKY